MNKATPSPLVDATQSPLHVKLSPNNKQTQRIFNFQQNINQITPDAMKSQQKSQIENIDPITKNEVNKTLEIFKQKLIIEEKYKNEIIEKEKLRKKASETLKILKNKLVTTHEKLYESQSKVNELELSKEMILQKIDKFIEITKDFKKEFINQNPTKMNSINDSITNPWLLLHELCSVTSMNDSTKESNNETFNEKLKVKFETPMKIKQSITEHTYENQSYTPIKINFTPNNSLKTINQTENFKEFTKEINKIDNNLQIILNNNKNEYNSMNGFQEIQLKLSSRQLSLRNRLLNEELLILHTKYMELQTKYTILLKNNEKYTQNIQNNLQNSQNNTQNTQNNSQNTQNNSQNTQNNSQNNEMNEIETENQFLKQLIQQLHLNNLLLEHKLHIKSNDLKNLQNLFLIKK